MAPRRALPFHRPGVRPSIIAALLIVAISLLALTIGGGLRPAGGVNGAQDTPSERPTTDPGASTPASPSSVATPAATTIAAVADPPTRGQQVAATDRLTTPRVTPRPAKAAATPAPERTSSPTSTSTPTPTPDPTATPDPPPATPDPGPVCMTVPDLVGMSVLDARAAWTGAGFTGQFDPKNGQNDKIVLTQSRAAGDCMPARTRVKVTFA